MAALSLLAVTYLYPFVFVIGTALKPRDQFVHDPHALPTSFTAAHIKDAWATAELGRALINSLIAVGLGVVVCVVVSSLAAFWFRIHTTRLSRLMLLTFGGLWIVPQVIWVISFFIILSRVGLTNNLVVLGVVYGTVFTPTTVWILWGYSLHGVPREVIEASSLDGATRFQQYRRIFLPLNGPAIGATAALAFVFGWGDLLLSLVLIQDADKFTVVTATAGLTARFDTGVQAIAAAAVLTLLPSLVVFLGAQRWIIKGVTAGVSR